jgi:Prokaryotic N-terminal methylation motif
MRRPAVPIRKHGFTLIELMVSGVVASAVGLAVFAFLNAGMYLTAKNLSLNYTSNQMRTALDRVEQVLQQGDADPVLIDASGVAVTGAAAAGVKLDRFVGGPWVVTTGGGSIPVGTTTLTLTRSTNALASPPLPTLDDMVRIDGTASTLRPRIGGAPTVGTVSAAQRQSVTVPLAAPLPTAITSGTSSVLTAKLVRQVAFIVKPNGAKRELRYYPSIETTTNLNDATKYTVITDQIGTQSADATPFTVATISGKTFVNFSLRVGATTYNQRLLNKQSDEYNTFSRVESVLRPKVNP